MASTFIIEREEIQKNLCKNFLQYINHSYGTSGMSHFIDQLPKGVHRKRAILWVETFTSMRLVASAPVKFKRNKLASDDYDSASKSRYWAMGQETKTKSTVYDAGKEFRKVFERLRKIEEDPENILLHAALVSKVKELLYAYGRSDECDREEKRGRTLFDQSTKMTTMRASKLAKGT